MSISSRFRVHARRKLAPRWFAVAAMWAWLASPLNAAAQSSPPATWVTTSYASAAELCFNLGEWTGDLGKAVLRYRLVIAPEHQRRYGDIFVGLRRRSAPDKLWLYGFSLDASGRVSSLDWRLYDGQSVPMAAEMGQSFSAIHTVDILPRATDLTSLAGDAELLLGYGVRNNAVGSTPADAFKEMVDARRYSVIWQIDAQTPARFGTFACVPFTELKQRVSP